MTLFISVTMKVTGSSNFPTQNPIQPANAGGTSVSINGYEFKKADLFITRFNTNGTALLSSTYIGGTGNDGLNTNIVKNYGDAARGEVVVDGSNNIYVTGATVRFSQPSILHGIPVFFSYLPCGVPCLRSL